MRILRVGALAFFNLAGLCTAEGLLDRVDEALTISAFGDVVRARLSGTLDLEAYHFDTSAPGLIFTPRDGLFNPRLTVFLDAQIGEQLYLFGQARADRGFDPANKDAEVRLDEYALRYTPWNDGRLNVQVGKFATVVGNWATRHGSWENPFITAPVPYENTTAIWDSEPADSSATLYSWAHVRDGAGGFYGNEYSDKILRQPVIWGPAYTSGASVSGRVGKVTYAVEFKNGPLSARPESWDATQLQWQHPTYSGRLGYTPSEMWKFGLSASTGSYLLPIAAYDLTHGYRLDDYRQTVFGQDIAFAWHQWQLWAEFFETRFEIPGVGHADTFAYYLEAKYKFTPQFFGALRWNQQFFNHIDGRRWGRDLWRTDFALGYRFTAHTQLKLQYSLQHEEDGPDEFSHIFAAQFTLRF